MDSVSSTFIWNGKHPCLSKVYLQRSRRVGGMFLSNFSFTTGQLTHSIGGRIVLLPKSPKSGV